MSETEVNTSEFLSFRALKEDASPAECSQLFGHIAQLYSFVSDRCDDEQVAQYDKVLLQLADMVEAEALIKVAGMLSRLERAPGGVVVRLASDTIEVARPLLEFSKVLSDDDLIEIVIGQTEDHRVVIAGRDGIGERVGDAIAEHGAYPSLAALAGNQTATLGAVALEKMITSAANDTTIADDLRGRQDVDWNALAKQIGEAGARVMSKLSLAEMPVESEQIKAANAMVYARLKNRVGFSAREWKTAWNQVKALNDRRRLDKQAVARFARFGYGHHVACGLTVMMHVPAEVFVKWLSTQDYVAMTVTLRALGLDSELMMQVFPILPWRDAPSQADIQAVEGRFEGLSLEEAQGIVRLWRAHAFRRKSSARQEKSAVA